MERGLSPSSRVAPRSCPGLILEKALFGLNPGAVSSHLDEELGDGRVFLLWEWLWMLRGSTAASVLGFGVTR